MEEWNKMLIAPGFTADEWFALQLEQNVEKDWQIAVDVLKLRLYSRYIDPLDILVSSEDDIPHKDRRFGFTILAIDLLLMETLQSFKEGIFNTSGKSKIIFIKFLENSPHFSPYFPDKKTREDFYEYIRCGILHQGEIQSSALVWSLGELYERCDGIEVINRNAVHKSLKQDLNDYLLALRDPANKQLRKCFKSKMDTISGRGNIAQ